MTGDIRQQKYSNVISVWKFLSFIIASFGFYEIYWLYKNWKFFKEKDNLDVSPFWRAIFAIFFIHSLFKRMLELARSEGYDELFSPGWLTAFWFVFNIMSNLPDPYWLISFLSLFALLPPLKAMNFYWKKVTPDLPERPLKWWQILLIILGFLCWGLVFIGLFIQKI